MNFMKGTQCPTNKYFDLYQDSFALRRYAGRSNEAQGGSFFARASRRVESHSRESNGWRAMHCILIILSNRIPCQEAIHSKRPRGVSKNPPTVNISCVQGVV
eukprot:scaffold7834_cov143-Skeletonema_marinoi.AAC.2